MAEFGRACPEAVERTTWQAKYRQVSPDLIRAQLRDSLRSISEVTVECNRIWELDDRLGGYRKRIDNVWH